MVDLCSRFVSARNLTFGTNVDSQKSKTKCIMFSKKSKANFLDGNKLPWVDNVKHLGHTLQSDNKMTMDIVKKKRYLHCKNEFIAPRNSFC